MDEDQFWRCNQYFTSYASFCAARAVLSALFCAAMAALYAALWPSINFQISKICWKRLCNVSKISFFAYSLKLFIAIAAQYNAFNTALAKQGAGWNSISAKNYEWASRWKGDFPQANFTANNEDVVQRDSLSVGDSRCQWSSRLLMKMIFCLKNVLNFYFKQLSFSSGWSTVYFIGNRAGVVWKQELLALVTCGCSYVVGMLNNILWSKYIVQYNKIYCKVLEDTSNILNN